MNVIFSSLQTCGQIVYLATHRPCITWIMTNEERSDVTQTKSLIPISTWKTGGGKQWTNKSYSIYIYIYWTPRQGTNERIQIYFRWKGELSSVGLIFYVWMCDIYFFTEGWVEVKQVDSSSVACVSLAFFIHHFSFKSFLCMRRWL